MKLYSRQQIILTIAITSVVVLSVCSLGFMFLVNGSSSTISKSQENNIEETLDPTIDDKSIVGQTITVPENSDSFVLQTAVKADPIYSADVASSYTQDELQNITVYEKCNEAVVNINTQVVGYNWFLEPMPQDGGSGSGSIIDTRGYVLTNVHVVADAYKIYISLADGSQFEGRVIGTDTASDIAVLKFDPPSGVELKTIPFGDSSKLKVGQKLIAIGNPFGLERTLTTGVVSGLGRPIQTANDTIIRNMIQTDTAINPGNSGGPLLDTQGRMIGINTMIYSTSGSSAGIGFAVPVDTARRVVSDLIQYGKVRRGSIEASLVPLNSSLAKAINLDLYSGMLVSDVVANGNAQKAGIKGGTIATRYGTSRNYVIFNIDGDIITAIDGIQVETLADYYSALESKKPGDSVLVTVYRNKKYTTFKVILASSE